MELLTQKRFFLFSSLVGLLLLAAACQLPVDTSDAAAGDSTAITAPADGAHVPNNQTQQIMSSVSASGGAAAAVLKVNGVEYRQDTFLNTVHTGQVYQPWTPHLPGEYQLQVVILAQDGASIESAPITVFVGDIVTYTDTPIAAFTETPTAMEAITSTVTATPTTDKPTATVNQNAFCRSGPYTGYPETDTFGPGQQLEITGINQERTWLQVQSLVANRKCWIWIELVDVGGNLEQIDTVYVAPPAKPTHTPTKKPTRTPTATTKPVIPTKQP